jgi:hypothetical protein
MFFTYELGDGKLQGFNLNQIVRFVGKREARTERLVVRVYLVGGDVVVLPGQELYASFLEAVRLNSNGKIYGDDEF